MIARAESDGIDKHQATMTNCEEVESRSELELWLYLNFKWCIGSTLGSKLLELLEHALDAVEQSARWCSPNYAHAELTLPLPWLIFLPLLPFIRLLVLYASTVSLLLGNGVVTVNNLIEFIQRRRQKIRLAMQPAKVSDMRPTLSAGCTKSTPKLNAVGGKEQPHAEHVRDDMMLPAAAAATHEVKAADKEAAVFIMSNGNDKAAASDAAASDAAANDDDGASHVNNGVEFTFADTKNAIESDVEVESAIAENNDEGLQLTAVVADQDELHVKRLEHYKTNVNDNTFIFAPDDDDDVNKLTVAERSDAIMLHYSGGQSCGRALAIRTIVVTEKAAMAANMKPLEPTAGGSTTRTRTTKATKCNKSNNKNKKRQQLPHKASAKTRT